MTRVSTIDLQRVEKELPVIYSPEVFGMTSDDVRTAVPMHRVPVTLSAAIRLRWVPDQVTGKFRMNLAHFSGADTVIVTE
jgi:hypothetical protein